jgi:DNA-directed RNA polymerase I, II, and III subunit RPABC2
MSDLEQSDNEATNSILGEESNPLMKLKQSITSNVANIFKSNLMNNDENDENDENEVNSDEDVNIDDSDDESPPPPPIGNDDDDDDDDDDVSDSDINSEDDDSDMDDLIQDDDENEHTVKKNKPKTTPKKNSMTTVPQVNIDIPLQFEKNDSDYDSSEDEDEDDEYLQKFDKEQKKNYIMDQHPECEIHNYNEIYNLAKVQRNKDNIIVDDLHKTIPILTKYEKTRILGIRAKQINNGAKPMVTINTQIIDGYLIALKELEEKKIPVIIRRPIPNGASEYWRLKDLEILQ